MKRYLLTIIAVTAFILPAATAAQSKVDTFGFKLSGAVDMQVQKNLYEQLSSSSAPSRTANSVLTNYRQLFDDFWMRVALKGQYRSEFLEGAFNFRFYPYWTMRQNYVTDNSLGSGGGAGGGADLAQFINVLELTQAYFKAFKNYEPMSGLTFQPSFKVGRDGLQNSSSELFGNYLVQPAGGYGQSRFSNVVGPFLNRKIFANQIEAAFSFNVFGLVGGNTSLMAGGNLNNDKFYNSMVTQFFQTLDSKLSAGFYRVYQDLYFFDKRIHLGGGIQQYTSVQDSAGSGDNQLIEPTYFAAQGMLDVVIMRDVKFYTEIAMQKMSSDASTGIVRPINMGITIPTFGVVDTLAVECENVGKTYMLHNPFYTIKNNESFFDPRSMRDGTGGRGDYTQAFAWGIVLQKKYMNRLNVAWGLYTSNPYQDMSTTLRFSSTF